MKNNKRFLFHILQQITAFTMALSIGFLTMYSYARYDVSSHASSSYQFGLFSREADFEDTEVFDEMLISSLHSIIRYNVAKSQLETDGKFDGSKLIDVAAFANRKNKNDIVGKVNYTLEDLLKWGQYGVEYTLQDYTEEAFLALYGIDDMKYNGLLTDEQKNALRGVFFDVSEMPQTSENAESIELEIYDANISMDYDTYAESDDKENAYQGNAKLESLFKRATQITENSMKLGLDDNREAEMLQQLAETIMSASDVISGIYIEPETEELHVICVTLDERYKPSNGGTLMSHLDSLSEYSTYIVYITNTVSDLTYNYNEYLELKDSFGAGNTNILFYFQMTMLGKPVVVSNLGGNTLEGDMDAYFTENCGKYVIYKPQNITLNTNTHILTIEEMFDAFNSYEYAYPDTAKIYIGVDTSYPVEDVFSGASEVYHIFYQYRIFFIILFVCSLFAWIILTLYLSVRAGRVKVADGSVGIRLTWFDQIPTEIYLFLLCNVLFWGYFGLKIFDNWNNTEVFSRYRMHFTLLAGFCGMIISCFFCAFWYSLIRRLKKGSIIKGSILYFIWDKVVKKLFLGIRNCAVSLYDNAGLLLRSLLIMGSIMAYNFFAGIILMFQLDRGRIGFSMFLFLFLFFVVSVDVLVAYCWYRSRRTKKKLIADIKKLSDGNITYHADTAKLYGENLELAEAVNSIGASIKSAVETSMKDEKLKADLITNVSHDIKTPLTSIINYVDLLKREKIETQPVKGYIEILDAKSQRLKHLTEDLVEASKISSGNIVLHPEKIDVIELLHQTLGEFSEKFEEKHLKIVDGFSGESVLIWADSRRIFRVVENLFGNICKYAMPESRVYVDRELTEDGKYVILSLKNISAQSLNIKAEELTQRFIRGDVARSTEGSGLGLSIAKNLTELQGGKFDVYLDGDLFKVTLTFPVYDNEQENA